MQKISKLGHFGVLLMLVSLVSLSGCAAIKFPGVYRIPILQGNIIDSKKVNQLELGMSKRQVRFIMGSPLVNDVFNDDRWDYFYSLQRGGKSLRDKRFILYFEDDKLARWEGDFEPKAESEEVTDEYIIEDAKKTEG